MGEFKKTLTASSCGTLPSNNVNEQNNETARAKYNLVGFSAVLCKTTTLNEHFPSFVEDVYFSLENLEVNSDDRFTTIF